MTDGERHPWMAAGRLRVLRDALSVGQVAIALATVALAGGVSTPSLIAFVVLVGAAWWRPLPAVASMRSQRIWTALVFVALVGTLVRAITRAEFLDAGVDFLLLLIVQRLFNRQRAREHSQLLLLGTLLLVVGAVINTELSYPTLLVLYLFVAAMALLVNNLMAEGERLGERAMMRLGREGYRRRGSLWRAAGTVAGLAGAGALLTFLLFPRFGAGVFLRGRMAGDSQSGFSDDVQLGGFGTIKTDTTVVMRIRPDTDPGSSRPTWHLRGSSFDLYEDGHWRHGPEIPSRPLRATLGYRAVTDGSTPRLVRASGRRLQGRPKPGFERATEVSRATVLMEDIGADVLFVPSEPVAIQMLARGEVERRARPIGGRNHEIRVSKPPGPVQYRAVWRTTSPTRAELEAVGDPPHTSVLAPFVQRSAALSPEVGELARRIVGSAPNRLAKVEALHQYLQTFEYTLEQRPSARVSAGADPLEGFLFDTRAGHCEYFATALAVLLREVDVPTRIVNGYYGAHRNEVGGYYAVRQADAHSWVEVHFDTLGWVTFDPTPPSGRTAGDNAAWWPAATELLDALRNTYLEYVIDYDLSKQLAVLEGLGMRSNNQQPRGLSRWLFGGIAAFAVLAWLFRRFRRQRRVDPYVETRLLRRVLARLRGQGFTVGASESVNAIADRLVREDHPAAGAITEFLATYERLRFGPQRDPATLRTLQAHAHAALRALRAARSHD